MHLSDMIEAFIQSLLTQEEDEVELRRGELAQHFGCAPSQINYVLSTRFTVERGYIITSRRGEGGYIRLVRVARSGRECWAYVIERIGRAISQEDTARLLLHLLSQELISQAEARLMQAATSDQALSPFAGKDALRAGILKAMIMSIRKEKETKTEQDSTSEKEEM